MNTLQQRQEIDEIATCDPEVLGYGYSDSQHPWHHDPAIDHPRDAWLDFVDHLRATLPAAPTILQIGLGRRGGSHLALTTLGGRVVAVDGDAAAIARLGAAARFRGDPEDLVLGDGRDEATSTAVRARAPHFDCVVLDGDGTRAGMAAAWRRWAPLVRAGGVVAIVDRTQAVGVLAPRYRVDAFVAELARDRLEPCGVRMQRFGAAAAIHAYRQHERLCADSSDTPAAAADPEAPAVLGVGDGFARFTALGGCFAVAVDEAPYCPLRASRNGFSLVLTAASEPALIELGRAFGAAEPALANALRALRDGDLAAAAAAVAALGADAAALRGALIPCLEQTPWSRRLLLALAVLALFGDRPREGVALLRRALRLQPMDGELVATAAAAYLRVLQDEVGARDLLAEARREVRLRQVAEICHRELRGNVLWHYPKLVAEVQGVLQIGACADDVAAAWDRLELPTQLYVEARADHCAELERCEPVVPGRRRAIVEAVLGAEVGSAALRFGDDPSRASLLRQHPLAVVAERFRQRHEVPVPLATLDELVARGEVDPDGCNLLYVDVEGTELEVLRGAVATLPHFDLVCVAVYLLPVYDGAPLLQEIQTFLHDFDPEGEHGFGLRAFELGADPGHGHAVFRRLKPRT